MKIAVIDSTQSGHRETFYKQFARSWQALGHEVCLVAPTPVEDAPAIEHRPLAFRSLLPLPAGKPLQKKWTLLRNAMIRLQNLSMLRAHLREVHPDLVFFACLDDFLPTLSTPFLLRQLMPYRWSGLLVQSALPTFKWYVPDVRPALRHPQCTGIGVLNEYTVDALQSWQPHIECMPDFADLSAPNMDYPLAQEINQKAAGRKVISLLGSINKRKGIDLLMNTIPQLDPTRYYFVIAGQPSLTTDETERLQTFAAHHDNVLLSLQRIPTEADFNALVVASDVIFAAYLNFTGSSNLLTKAAAFGKPVLGSTGQCIGKRLLTYGTGLSSTSESTLQCKAVIEQLCDINTICAENLTKYADLHRTERLLDCLNNLIE